MVLHRLQCLIEPVAEPFHGSCSRFRLGGTFRRDHNLWSALSRYMVMESPALLSAIRFRETPLDEVDLAAYWRDIVGEDRFAAESLDEARAVWDVQRGAR